MKFSINPATVWLIGGIVLTVAGSAWAEKNPYYIGGSLGVSHVSNVYRQASTNNSDNVTTYGLLGGIDQTLGRQRVFVDASLQDNRYASNEILNNRGYSLKGGLDWVTVGNLSGTVSGSTSNALASYNVGGGVTPVFKKVLQKNNQYQAIFRLGVVTRYSIEGGITHNDQTFSEPEYQILDYRQNAGSLGIYYAPHDKLRLGLAGRVTSGAYPRYPTVFSPFVGSPPVLLIVNDEFKRRDIDLTTNWTLSGASRIDARVSLSRLRRDIAAAQDFSGVTGFLAWAWQPRASLNFYTQVVRDNGQDGGATGTSPLNRVSTAVQLSASYAISAKFALSASASVRRSDTSSETSLYRNYDNDHGYNLGLRWAYSRSLSVSCQMNSSARNSSIQQYTYDARSYGCTAQAMIY